MASPIQQSSSEDVTSINIRDGTDNGEEFCTAMLSDFTQTQWKHYDGTNLRVTKTIYYASLKLLDDLDTVGNWVGSADEDSTAVNSNGWLDGATDVVRVTYTYSTGTVTLTDATTNHGDLSNYVGSGCDQGYVTLIQRLSDFSNVTSLQLKFGSGAGDYRSVSINGSEASNSWVSNNEYVGLIFDLSAGSDTGTPDGTGINYIQLNWTVASGASKTIDIKDLYVVGAQYATTTDETSNQVAGSDFDGIRSQVLNNAYEGKTALTEQYVYESETTTIFHKSRSGGY